MAALLTGAKTSSRTDTVTSPGRYCWTDTPSGRAVVWARARVMKAAICPRVTDASGEKLPPPVPLATPSSNSALAALSLTMGWVRRESVNASSGSAPPTVKVPSDSSTTFTRESLLVADASSLAISKAMSARLTGSEPVVAKSDTTAAGSAPAMRADRCMNSTISNRDT